MTTYDFEIIDNVIFFSYKSNPGVNIEKTPTINLNDEEFDLSYEILLIHPTGTTITYQDDMEIMIMQNKKEKKQNRWKNPRIKSYINMERKRLKKVNRYNPWLLRDGEKQYINEDGQKCFKYVCNYVNSNGIVCSQKPYIHHGSISHKGYCKKHLKFNKK